MDLLQKSIVRLTLDGKIFYSTLLCKMEKIPSKIIPTAGVTIENGQIKLFYNPSFLQKQYDEEENPKMKLLRICAILEHELLHLVYEHVLRSKLYNRIPEIYNIATDIAINQYIPDLDTSKFLTPNKFDLPSNKDAEFYYNELVKNAKFIHIEKLGNFNQNQQNSNSKVKYKGKSVGKQVDSHEKWKNSSNDNLTKEVLKQAVREAYQQSQKSRGYLPSYLEEQIEKLLTPPTISWKTLLRQYVGNSVKTGFRSSWKRPNRRLGEDFKGKISKRTIKIAVAIDTSGSVGSEEFKEFISEIKGIMNSYKSSIKIIECDAIIQKEYELKPYSKIDTKFKGRGGTDYKPVFDLLNKKREIDLLIYFTDLYCDFNECNPRGYEVIWICTSKGNYGNKPPFGKLIRIKKENE